MKRLKKGLRSSLCLLLSTVFVFACFLIPASAYTTTTTGEFDISPSKKDFKNAKNPKYTDSTVTISDSISESQEMDIYHFEAPKSGYYAIYTTGSLDTIGAVYEQKNVLFVTTSYDQVAYADDTNYSPYYRNFLMVVKMEWHEDYYICVRAYASLTGTLVIEPNQDKKNIYTGGVWQCDYLDTSSALLGFWVDRKEYFTKQQALMYYLFLLVGDSFPYKPNGITFDMIRQTYNQDIYAAISMASTFFGILTASAPSTLSISVTLLGALVDGVYDVLTTSAAEIDQVKNTIVNLCGISASEPQMINGNQCSIIFTIQNGLLKETYFSQNSIPVYVSFYSTYNDSNWLLTGSPYCYGSWTRWN